MTCDLLSPDTPLPVLSDWAEEHAPDYGFTAERNEQGELIITVPARADGLPDWDTFLKVGKAMRGADGWVMEGAEPDPPSYTGSTFNWFCHNAYYQPSVIPCEIWHQCMIYGSKHFALADLSAACVKWTRI